jgi:hypothetical protein
VTGDPVAVGAAGVPAPAVAVGAAVGVTLPAAISPPAGGVTCVPPPPFGGVAVRKPGALPRSALVVAVLPVVASLRPPGTSGELQAPSKQRQVAAATSRN